MSDRYYIYTCIWMDYYKNRFGFRDEPLGDYSFKFLMKAYNQKSIIILSDVLVQELKQCCLINELQMLFKIFEKNLYLVTISDIQFKEAFNLSKKYDIPLNDCMHVILAQDNNAVLVTRDKHFQKLKEIVRVVKPEELF